MNKKLHASEQQKIASRSNIETKISILNNWSKQALPWRTDEEGNLLRDRNGDKVVEWFPRNASQFCHWDGSQCSPGTQQTLPDLYKISRSTFYRDYNEDLKHNAENLFEVLVTLEGKMASSASSASEIEKLKKDLSYWRTVAKAEADTVLTILKKLNEVEKKYLRSERVRKNNEEQLKMQISELRAEKAALDKVLAKISPMKSID